MLIAHRCRDRFNLLVRPLQFVCLVLWLSLLAGNSLAATRAVVVGVTDYPALDARLWLKGPSNDAMLMAEVLKQRADAQEIQILIENTPESLPTRANILAALEKVARDAVKSDTVVLFFAGHGSQQPSVPGDLNEKDGLDEIFLPRDAEGWEIGKTKKDEAASVKNAIIDNDVAAFVDRIRAKGAFVIVLFDSCHSETMTRGAAPASIRYRTVSPQDLGIKPIVRFATRGEPSPAAETPALDGLMSDQGGYVALYAAQSFEVAPEMDLPWGAPSARPHGLFTYTVAHALMTRSGMTWRQLRDELIARYRSQAVWNPTPQVQGSGLDQIVFGDSKSFRRDSWGLEITGQAMSIPAGSLEQLNVGDRLAVLASPLDALDKRIGVVRVDDVTVSSAVVSLEQGPNGERSDMSRWPSRPVVTRMDSAVVLDLKVAIAPQWPTTVDPSLEPVVHSAVDILKGSLNRARLSISALEDADIVLTPAMLIDDVYAHAVPAQRPALFIGPRAATIHTGGKFHTHAVLLHDPETGKPRDAGLLSAILKDSLVRLAKAINLQRLALSLEAQAERTGLNLQLSVAPAIAPKAFKPAESLQDLKLGAGDVIRIEALNEGRSPVDLTILYIDSEFGISPLYPDRAGESARLQPNEKVVIDDLTVNEDTIGEETLLFIAVPGDGPVPRDYLQLAQPAMIRTRAKASAIDYLISEGQDVTTRGLERPALNSGDTALIKTVRLVVKPGV